MENGEVTGFAVSGKKKIVERSSHNDFVLSPNWQKILHVHHAYYGMQLCIFIENMRMRGLTMLDKLCKDFIS